MAYNFPGIPSAGIPPIGMGPMGLGLAAGHQGFMELGQGFPALPPPLPPLPGMNDSPLEFSTKKNQPPPIRESTEESTERRTDTSKNEPRRGINGSENRDARDSRDNGRRSRNDRVDRRDRDRDRDRRDERSDRDRRDERRLEERSSSGNNQVQSTNTPVTTSSSIQTQIETVATSPSVWSMGVGYQMMGMAPIGPPMSAMLGEMTLGPHMSHTHHHHGYGPMGLGLMPHPHEGAMLSAQMLGTEQIMNDTAQQMMNAAAAAAAASLQAPTPAPSHQNTNNNSGSTTSNPVTKEIIHCKSCTLFPPNPNTPERTTREKPPGCRTVFVGGLPENITDGIIQEIFERCGEITTLRLSKKNFCHIRFASETSVDAAIYLSGYRIRIGSNVDSANTGRLYVDFAHIYARDDQYEWECKQRQLQREQRHRERVEKERQRQPSSPPPVVHYTDYEASNICEKIKQDDTFMKAVQIVVTWLERGDCTKRNSNTFYSMIQSTNSHVRRLLSEKSSYEEELQRAKELMKGRMQGLLIQFSQIERVFTAASHKKVWDHFTKAQRKNIEMWKKQSSFLYLNEQEIKAVQLEEAVVTGVGEGEMEVSDSEEEPQRKKVRAQVGSETEGDERVHAFKEESESLRCQLEAYKNEVDLLKSENKIEIDAKDKQIKMLQQTLKGMQEQLLQSQKQQIQDDQKIKDLTVKLNASGGDSNSPTENEVITLDKDDDSVVVSEEPRTPRPLVAAIPGCVQITQKDAKLIGLMATFLHIHPFGASVDYVWSYLQKMEPGIRPSEVEALMQRFPQVFKQELLGIGANMERRWQFSGFNLQPSRSAIH
ncbi:ecto-NOX disulfide-thiol exchanger 2 isoform X1 [Microplitis demolitor]|uniref:ecto-NOX disulfide-thiol exchanger 2 isoform X1 n=1 Tax=Microplitis demolitor TaxID=69319 RepID=UPI0004CDD046|nr:ecto-NOX disulfide-thiol exchanger 2 isoform X1 [Microplitis demolitor]